MLKRTSFVAPLLVPSLAENSPFSNENKVRSARTGPHGLISLKTAVLSYRWSIVLGIVEKKHEEKMSDVLSEYKYKSYQ